MVFYSNKINKGYIQKIKNNFSDSYIPDILNEFIVSQKYSIVLNWLSVLLIEICLSIVLKKLIQKSPNKIILEHFKKVNYRTRYTTQLILLLIKDNKKLNKRLSVYRGNKQMFTSRGSLDADYKAITTGMKNYNLVKVISDLDGHVRFDFVKYFKKLKTFRDNYRHGKNDKLSSKISGRKIQNYTIEYVYRLSLLLEKNN